MQINGHELEFIESEHIYVVDGIIVPSVTQVLEKKFGHKYDGISQKTLNAAAEKGTAVHKAIEDFERQGTESDLPELRNYKFLKRMHKFECVANEVPVLYFGDIVCAGRLDMVIQIDGVMGLADIKRTSTLDKEYLAYQLNIYRLAYQQSYGVPIERLYGIHLREDVRKFVPLPINEELTKQFLGGKNE